jgi:hypothetical protein
VASEPASGYDAAVFVRRWVLVASGAALVGAAAYQLLGRTAGSHDAAAYASAPACEPTPAPGCLRSVSARVVELEKVRETRHRRYYVRLELPEEVGPGRRREVQVDGDDWAGLTEGATVDVELWGNRVPRIAVGGELRPTLQHPGKLAGKRRTIALATAVLGVLFVLLGLRRRAQPSST